MFAVDETIDCILIVSAEVEGGVDGVGIFSTGGLVEIDDGWV